IIYFLFYPVILYFFFFFQAEDGIRDFHVTGVQTCALPIFTTYKQGLGISYTPYLSKLVNDIFLANVSYYNRLNEQSAFAASIRRSEERRVGKECRSRWSP